jgi:hypothetical protein
MLTDETQERLERRLVYFLSGALRPEAQLSESWRQYHTAYGRVPSWQAEAFPRE